MTGKKEKTISGAMYSEPNLEHNLRTHIPPNSVEGRHHLNWVYTKDSEITLQQVYEKLFAKPYKEWRDREIKKGRGKRFSLTYYEKIEQDKQKHLCYEIIWQVGDMRDTGFIYTLDDAHRVQDLLDEFAKNGYVLIVTEIPGKHGEEVSDEIIKTVIEKKGTIEKLKGSGDFSSDECIEYLKECDICCTNPPFSLFASLFSLLIKYEKQYLLIGNQNAITYKEIFPYIKENKAWVGYRFGDMSFRVPDDTEPRSTRFWVDECGQKWRSLGNAMWLTNLDMPKRHQELILTAHYDPEKYTKYDDFDGINVQKVADIPMDYFGIMGVPITYLKYHNGEQFEIVGEANHGSDNEFDLFKPKVNGKELFKRILIKRIEKKPSEFKILDLFCGAGGLSWGMDKNPYFKTMVALDFDENAANTFKKNMPYLL